MPSAGDWLPHRSGALSAGTFNLTTVAVVGSNISAGSGGLCGVWGLGIGDSGARKASDAVREGGA